MTPSKWRAASVAVLALAVANMGMISAAQAGIVATSAIVRTDRDADLSSIRSHLERADVRAQMEKLGVDATVVDSRVAALSDNELHDMYLQNVFCADHMTSQTLGHCGVVVRRLFFGLRGLDSNMSTVVSTHHGHQRLAS